MWEGLAPKKSHAMKQHLEEPSRLSSTSTPKTPENPEEHPGAKKNAMEALTDLYEMTSFV
jgi:hypothetical protein